MEKALKIGRASVIGGFQLFVGKVISTIILAIGTVVLGRLILPSEYGLYTVALVPASMISLFQDWGVSSAMTKYIAHFRALDYDGDVCEIIIAGLMFESVTGLSLFLLSLFLANFIASNVFHRPESTLLISIASVTIFSGSLLKAAQSTFMGFERMELNSLTMSCQSIVQSVMSPLLVFFGYGALGAVIGYTLSFLISSILGLIMLYLILLKNLRKGKKSKTLGYLKIMLQYGVPLSISTVLAGFRMQFYSFMMAFFCSDLMIGNYTIATNFAVVLTLFRFPISSVLFPAFSKLKPQNNPELLKTVFIATVKYASLLLVPATMALMTLSKPTVYLLFGDKWRHAPFFLTLYLINSIFVIFGGLIMGVFLAGMGETKTLMKLSLVTFSFGLPLAFILIPTLGIVGVIFGNILAGIPSMFLGLYWIWKHYQVKADFRSSFKTFLASTIAAITTYASQSFLGTPEWITLVIGSMIFLLVYLLVVSLIGAVNKSDIENIRTMLSGLGIISTIVDIPLALTEKITNITH
jgi:O-antigen/teichoic acid export membrane protein